MEDTLRTSGIGIAGATFSWLEWAPPLFSALAALATFIYMLIKIKKELSEWVY